MEHFVLLLKHTSDQCPTANSTVRKLFMRGASELPKLAQKLGVKFVAGPLISAAHTSVAVVQAEKVDAVRDLVLQWNSIEVVPSITIEQAIVEVEKLTPIY